MEVILKLVDNEYPLEYIDHTRKTARAILVNEKGKIVDYGSPDYIIPKYDNKEFAVEL